MVILVEGEEDEDVGGWKDEVDACAGDVVLMVEPDEASDEADTLDTTEDTLDRSTITLVLREVFIYS
jgi:hypothetical protein